MNFPFPVHWSQAVPIKATPIAFSTLHIFCRKSFGIRLQLKWLSVLSIGIPLGLHVFSDIQMYVASLGKVSIAVTTYWLYLAKGWEQFLFHDWTLAPLADKELYG